jgi:hypothetical protein
MSTPIDQLKSKLLPDWEIIWNGDPWVRFSDNTLFMKECETQDETLQLFLHEYCHAIRGKGGHGADFWEQLEKIIWFEMRQPLNASQLKMKADYTAHTGQC